jgi:hypothetical protein
VLFIRGPEAIMLELVQELEWIHQIFEDSIKVASSERTP